MFGRNPPRQQPPPPQPGGAGAYSRIPPESGGRFGVSRTPERPLNEKYEHTRMPSSTGPIQLRPARSPSDDYTYGNMVAVSPSDFPQSRDSPGFYVILNDLYVCTARVRNDSPRGTISLSDFQRSWAR